MDTNRQTYSRKAEKDIKSIGLNLKGKTAGRERKTTEELATNKE